MDDQIFLFDHSDRMWFDPGERCWHCVLVRGETSKDGILVDAEGYAYARYAAYAPDCDRLRIAGRPSPLRIPGKSAGAEENPKKEGTGALDYEKTKSYHSSSSQQKGAGAFWRRR